MGHAGNNSFGPVDFPVHQPGRPVKVLGDTVSLVALYIVDGNMVASD